MTLDEKIKAAVTEIHNTLLQNHSLVGWEMLGAVLRRHLCEPWLDAPNALGWWWGKAPGESVAAFRITSLGRYGSKMKWQKIIEPVENVT